MSDTTTTAAPAFVMDFTKQTAPPPVSDGMHTAEIVEATPAVSKSNNAMIKVVWRITESDDPSNVGKKLFDYLTLTAEAFWKVTGLCTACDIDVSQWHGKPFNDSVQRELADTLLGETIVILTKVKPNTAINPTTGEKYPDNANVVRYLPFGSNSGAAVADLLGD